MCTRVQFFKGYGWDTRPPNEVVRFLRQDVTGRKAGKAAPGEWQEAAGEDLSEVTAPVKLILDDFAQIIELPGKGGVRSRFAREEQTA